MAEKRVVRYKLERHKWPDEIEAEKKEKRRKIILVVVCIAFFVSGFATNSLLKGKSVSRVNSAKLDAIYDVMKNDFYFAQSGKDYENALVDGAIAGMVNAGEDQHTMYMDQQMASDFTSSMQGSIVGIGVTMYELDNSTFIIADVLKDSPALKAGVQAGDRILEVDGEAVNMMNIDQVVEKVRGESGSSVELTLLRDDEKLKKKITREKVYGTVFSEILDDTAIIELTTFADTSGQEFGRHLEDIKKADVKKLIIDLRGNGGGYLQSALEIASYFIPKNSVIFQEQHADGHVEQYYTIDSLPRYHFDNIAVLVDEGTASASEALSGALKDQVNVQIVGTKTYGKGTVQLPYTFKDGSMIKYTIAEWMTPKGQKINKVGIVPDVVVQQQKAFTTPMPKLEKGEEFEANTVNVAATSVQLYLKFLGYAADREDAYFSYASSQALRQYQYEHGLEADGVIRAEVCHSLVSQVIKLQKQEPLRYDLQLKKAMEVVHG